VVIIMKNKPTIRQAPGNVHKQLAALNAGMLELKQRPQRIRDYYSKPKRELDAHKGKAGPHAQLKKQQADFEAHLKQMKTQAAAPAMEAEKRRIEERKRLAKADSAARAMIERPIKEHQARIAASKKLHEPSTSQTTRLKEQEVAAWAKLRGKQ
jgi:hypothetical protein